ncbi:MAG TPA: penicillin-insensitive murein endopeptidase [Methylomirabilota bacterium]|nr:penicillin-insensitive murein endopeptidase [Methylomirabilota bacterium]
MRRFGASAALLLLSMLGASAFGAGSTAAATAPLYPHQSLGNRGADVQSVQGFLRHRGATIAVDGFFGAATEAAVQAFQRQAGVQATGRVGETTWSALVVRVEPGVRGEAVKALQRQLNAKRGAGLAITGVDDAATVSAVRAFQKHARLTVNGIAGALTWRYLIAHFDRPAFGNAVCDYQVGNGLADWGTGAAIGQVEAAAANVVELGHGRVAIGDIGLEHGGDIAGHETHERGLDVDVRPMRNARDQCRTGVNYRSSAYDRAATRDLVVAVRATAKGHVKLIYFNDPVLIREGLVRSFTGHDDHLHIRYCEKTHPDPAYDC